MVQGKLRPRTVSVALGIMGETHHTAVVKAEKEASTLHLTLGSKEMTASDLGPRHGHDQRREVWRLQVKPQPLSLKIYPLWHLQFFLHLSEPIQWGPGNSAGPHVHLPGCPVDPVLLQYLLLLHPEAWASSGRWEWGDLAVRCPQGPSPSQVPCIPPTPSKPGSGGSL